MLPIIYNQAVLPKFGHSILMLISNYMLETFRIDKTNAGQLILVFNVPTSRPSLVGGPKCRTSPT